MADTAAVETGADSTATSGGKRSRWLAHVKKTMKAHKGKSLKQVLKMAKKTYKGGALSPADYSGAGVAPKTGGRRTRKSRKGGRKH